MAIVIKEWWLDQDIELGCKVQPPVGPSINTIKCCVDLTCVVDRDGNILIQRFALARGMKKNKYNASCAKAGQWLADQRCEMAVNQYLKANGNAVLEAEPRLSQEVLRRRVADTAETEEVPTKKKSGSLVGTLVFGVFKVLGFLLRLVFNIVRGIFRTFMKK